MLVPRLWLEFIVPHGQKHLLPWPPHRVFWVPRFTPDFTSSWVIRELTLVTAANLEFRFTLSVTLPHHLLPLCADVVPGPSWEEAFWRLTVFFVR